MSAIALRLRWNVRRTSSCDSEPRITIPDYRLALLLITRAGTAIGLKIDSPAPSGARAVRCHTKTLRRGGNTSGNGGKPIRNEYANTTKQIGNYYENKNGNITKQTGNKGWKSSWNGKETILN